jgi:chemotaxis protein CheD
VNTGTLVIVGVGDMAISADPAETLVTYALGSCLGVLAWDKQAKVGGLLHYMLPSSAVNPAKAQDNPAMFGDTGLQEFLQKLFQLGASRRHLVIKLAGGAEISRSDSFEIGKRNLLLARSLLWKNSLVPAAEAVGGKIGRTVRIDIATGRALLKEPGGERAF